MFCTVECRTFTRVGNLYGFYELFMVVQLHGSIDQITIKTPNPKCRLYCCLIEFIDWRNSQSCWYCRPLLWTSAPLTFSLVDLPPPLMWKWLYGKIGVLMQHRWAWITPWTSTWAKGGVCGPAVYFVLTHGDLQRREWTFCCSVMKRVEKYKFGRVYRWRNTWLNLDPPPPPPHPPPQLLSPPSFEQ